MRKHRQASGRVRRKPLPARFFNRRRRLRGRNLGRGLAGRNLGVMTMGRMRAAGGAFLGARAKRILDDLVDRARAAAAFGAAAETAVDLPCRARQIGRSAYRAADIVIAQHIAGTNDQGIFRCDAGFSIVKPQPQRKAKSFNFKIFQTGVVKSGLSGTALNSPFPLLSWLRHRPCDRFSNGLPATRCSRKACG
jgi:hypothetical protein